MLLSSSLLSSTLLFFTLLSFTLLCVPMSSFTLSNWGLLFTFTELMLTKTTIEDKHSEDTLSIGYGYPICNSQIPYGEEKEKEEEEEKEKEKEIYICSSPHSFYFGVVFQYRGPHIQKPRRGSMREGGCFFECGVKVG